MIPLLMQGISKPLRIPRESGDDPHFANYLQETYGYSPRERG